MRLGDACTKGKSSLRQKDLKNDGPFVVYGAPGIVGTRAEYQNPMPYVAIVKDGAGVGRACVCQGKSSVLGTMQALIPSEQVSCTFLLHLIRSMKLGGDFSGSTIPHIYFKDYSKREITLPTLDDQRRIVSRLDQIELLMNAEKMTIANLQTLVKSRFIEMFGDPGANGRNLPTEKLSKLGTLERGKSRHRPRNTPELRGGPNGPYPLVQTGDVTNAGLYLTEYNDTYTELGLQQSKMWDKGTLCITIAANIAQTTILGFDACFPDSIVGFIPGGRITNVYLHYWFSFFQGILEAQAPQAAQKNINLKILSDLIVTVPPLGEQKEFAAFVALAAKLEFVAQKQIEKLQLLYDSLAQEYFG